MGCVYFFKHNNMKYVKIGMSSKNTPYKRFSQFLTYAPMGGEILGYFNTYYPLLVEQEIHKELKDSRVYGEWFDVEDEQINGFIRRYSQMSKVRRIMFDIPIEVNEFHKNEKDLICIKTFFWNLHLKTSNLSYEFLYSILEKHSELTEYEISSIDIIGIYKTYFELKKIDNEGL